jgi:nucleoredoxin
MKSPALPLLFLLTALAAAAQSLEELAAKPELWPKEVAVLAATKATVLKGGQPAGAMLLGAGAKIVISAISAEGVTGQTGAATVRVPADKTDLMDRIAGGGSAATAARAQAQMKAVVDDAVARAKAKSQPAAPPETRSTSAPAWAHGSSPMQRRLAGKMVRLEDGKLQTYDAGQLSGVKYFALYFSASWCGPCKQFTPELVRAYGRLKKSHPEFELVFVSADHSAGDMKDYMKEDRMPWPALKYDQIAREPEIQRYGGPGIPCLVLVDAGSRVLSDSFEGDNYVGPGKVLQDTQRILRGG